MSPEVRDWWGVLAPDFGPSINTSIQQINRTSSAAVHPLLPPLIGHRQNNNYQSNYLINEFFPRFRFYRPTGYTHTHARTDTNTTESSAQLKSHQPRATCFIPGTPAHSPQPVPLSKCTDASFDLSVPSCFPSAQSWLSRETLDKVSTLDISWFGFY